MVAAFDLERASSKVKPRVLVRPVYPAPFGPCGSMAGSVIPPGFGIIAILQVPFDDGISSCGFCLTMFKIQS